jgi:hypothetical protein
MSFNKNTQKSSKSTLGFGNYGRYICSNVSRLCDGGEIEAEKLNLLLMFNQGTNVCFSTKAPLLQNRCYVPLFFKLWFHTI